MVTSTEISTTGVMNCFILHAVSCVSFTYYIFLYCFWYFSLHSLGGLMINSELIHQPLIRRFMHDELQIFLQQELARPLRKAHKKNKKVRTQLKRTTLTST